MATLDTLRWASKRMTVPLLLEVDVTAARRALRELHTRTGRSPGFTAWIVACVARAAAEHPRVHAQRRGKRQLVEFHDVDVTVLIERALGTAGAGETLPMPYVVRRANDKSVVETSDEIRRARAAELDSGATAIGAGPPAWVQSLFTRLPTVVRDLVVWRPLLGNPAWVKATMGTVAVSAVGMAAPGVLAWGIPLALHPLAIGVGGIAERTTPSGATEVLALSVVFDHAVTDGAAVARFVHRLHELLSQAYGLPAAGADNVPARAI